MLSVCSFITLFFFWNEIKEMKTKSGSVWLFCFVSSVYHVAACPWFHPGSAVTRDSLEERVGGRRGAVVMVGGGVYTCLHSHQHKQVRVLSQESTVTGEAQWKESLGRFRCRLCGKSVIGVIKLGKHWSCDQIWAKGDEVMVAQRVSGWNHPRVQGGHGEQNTSAKPAQNAYPVWTVVPKKHIYRLYKYMYV